MNDTISIVLPVFNSEKYIYRCIESILNQTYHNFELIIINDGSKDSSGIICDRFERIDSRIKVVHQTNQGAGLARKTGINLARGKYLTFIDSDDYYVENALERLYNAMDDSVDLVIAQHTRYTSDNSDVRQVYFHTGIFDFKKDGIVRYLCCEFFQYAHGVELWNKLFRTDIFKTKIDLNISLQFGEDLLLLLLYICYSNKLKCIEENLYFYEFRKNSLSRISKKSLVLIEYGEHIKKFLKDIETYGKYNEIYKSRAFIVYYLFNISLVKYHNFCKLQPEIVVRDLKKVSEELIIRCIAKEYFFSIRNLFDRKTYLPHKVNRIEANCFFLSILLKDEWFYTKLFLDLQEQKNSFIIVFKALFKRIFKIS